MAAASGHAGARVVSPEAGLAHCAKIQNTGKRLACFDKLARDVLGAADRWDGDSGSNKPAAPAARVIQGFRPSGFGEWVLRDATAADGSRDVALAIFTTGQAGGELGGSLRVALWLRCSDERTLLYIDWNAPVDTGGRAVVRMQTQVDGQDPEETHWARYSNRNVTGMYTERASVQLIKQLFGGSTLVARLNEEHSAFSASFNITGVEQAIAPVRQACDW